MTLRLAEIALAMVMFRYFFIWINPHTEWEFTQERAVVLYLIPTLYVGLMRVSDHVFVLDRSVPHVTDIVAVPTVGKDVLIARMRVSSVLSLTDNK